MRFEELLVGELEWLARLARRYYADSADAEDLFGETICRLIENKDRYIAGSPFRPWAKTVMENIYITAYNRRRCVLMRPLDVDYPYVSDRRSETQAEMNDLLSAINRLAKKSVCVEAVRLYALDGMSYDEIASTMGVETSVVRTRIATGRKIIKKALRIDKNWQTLR